MHDAEMQYQMMKRRYINLGLELVEALRMPKGDNRSSEVRKIRRRLEETAKSLYDALLDRQMLGRRSYDQTIH